MSRKRRNQGVRVEHIQQRNLRRAFDATIQGLLGMALPYRLRYAWLITTRGRVGTTVFLLLLAAISLYLIGAGVYSTWRILL